MTFLCELWPYLAGAFIGWLLAGWFARRLKHVEPPIERIVEKQVDKIVDNPKHLSLIGKLESENKKIPNLLSQIAGFESAPAKAGEKIVEKMVDNPKHLSRIKELEAQNKEISGLRSRISSFENQQSKQTSGNEESTRLLARIKELEANSETKSAGKSVEVDNPAHLKRISVLEAEIKDLRNGPEIDLAAAKAAGIKIKNENDLTAIEGIGPKINDLIHNDGVKTFASLADCDVPRIQGILDNAGSNYKMANPGTWPDQANLAANNRWGALKALQDVLDGGVYPDGSSDKASAGSNKSNDSVASDSKKEISNSGSDLDAVAAKAAGFKLKQKNGQDDFTLIEGIGPKINELIHNDEIHTFMELSKTLVEKIQEILDNAGPNYRLAKPSTWPAQADMAANNKWDALKAWQDELDGGEE